MTTGNWVTLVVAILGVLHGPAIPAVIKWAGNRKVKP